jgi:hypothetical protein
MYQRYGILFVINYILIAPPTARGLLRPFGEKPLEGTDLTAEDVDTVFRACSWEAGYITSGCKGEASCR